MTELELLIIESKNGNITDTIGIEDRYSEITLEWQSGDLTDKDIHKLYKNHSEDYIKGMINSIRASDSAVITTEARHHIMELDNYKIYTTTIKIDADGNILTKNIKEGLKI